MHYFIAIEQAEDLPQLTVIVPDLAGCFAEGDTQEEAQAAAKEAIAEWLAEALDTGRTIPPATPLAVLRRQPRHRRQRIWVEIEVNPSVLDETLERISIRLPRRLLKRLDAQARSAGESRSVYIARLALEGARVR